MPRIVRISAVQMATVIAGRSFAQKQANNCKHIQDMLKIAGERASDLVLFGEYANLHHRMWSSNKREYAADAIPGAFTRMMGRYARKYNMNVAMPLFGTYHGVLSSFVVLFDRKGRIAGCYQKTHPTVPELSLGMQAGNDLPVYELDFVIKNKLCKKSKNGIAYGPKALIVLPPIIALRICTPAKT
jgi:predicted amidohydrolase